MFRDCLAGRPFPRDTRENDNLARLFSFQSCAPHVLFCGLASRELLAKSTNLQISLSLHQLNTKLKTIKSHKIQGTKLEQLQHFLSWNKANIKHSCKSQIYIIFLVFIVILFCFFVSFFLFFSFKSDNNYTLCAQTQCHIMCVRVCNKEYRAFILEIVKPLKNYFCTSNHKNNPTFELLYLKKFSI